MKKYMLVFLVGLFVSACSTGADEIAATTVPVNQQSQTPLPSSASAVAPTATFIPAATPTETPIPLPTPLGGRDGRFLFSLNHFLGSEEIDASSEGIWEGNTDGRDLVQVFDLAQLTELTGEFSRMVLFSRNRTVYIGAVKFPGYVFYSLNDDMKIGNPLDLGGRFLIDFSLDGSQALVLDFLEDGSLLVVNLDGSGDALVRAGARTDNSNGWWSPTGEFVYFQANSGSEFWIAGADGTGSRILELASLDAFTPLEGVTPPTGVISLGEPPKVIDSYAFSPARDQVAFSWSNLILLADDDDPEFLSPELFVALPVPEGYHFAHIYNLQWNADGSTLMAIYSFSKFGGGGVSGTVIIDVANASIRAELPFSEFGSDCGFTPDGQLAVFAISDRQAQETTVSLVSLDGELLLELAHVSGQLGCPVWP